MSRRSKIVLWVVGTIAVAIGGLVVAFLLSSPAAIDLPLDAPTQEIPRDWLEEDPSSAQSETGTPDGGAEPTQPAEADAPSGPTVTSGRLIMIGDGKPFGEEAYELTVSEDRATLRSSGRFWFKVVLATVQITFEQTLEGGDDLQPLAYAAEFHAPLGFDRTVRATIEADRATVEGSDGTEEILIAPERTIALGTFSSYVLLPRLFSLHNEDGSASFDILVFGGPPGGGSDADSAGDGLPVLTIKRAGTAFLRAGELRLAADRYQVSSDLGESELYARGDEFLALRAGDEERSMWVYRSDYFPNGVEVEDPASPR